MAGLVILALGLTVVVVNATSTGPAALPSPAEANSALYTAAMVSGSFHYSDVSSESVGGKAGTAVESGEVGLSGGIQSMVSSLGDYEVIVTNSLAYMKADVAMLENMYGYASGQAAPYANRWIEFTAADAPYRAVTDGVTTGSTWGNPAMSPSDGMAHTPVSVTAATTVNGQSIQSVLYSQSGDGRTAHASFGGTERIFFAAASPHLPVSMTEQLSGTVNGQPATNAVHMTFSQWGAPVIVKAPRGAIPYSHLPGASPKR